MQAQAVDAVVQVAAKAAGVCGFAQVLVGGAHQRKVHRHRLAAAQGRDLAFLQHAQQAGLHGQRHVANLVEKQSAALGLAQSPNRALLARAGKGTGGVAKEFGLNQMLGQGGAVDGHKRAGLARRAVVQGFGNKLFAHA